MKLFSNVALAALVSLAVGTSPEPAEVYLFRSHLDVSKGATPQLPRQIARQLFLQRISADQDSLLYDVPDGFDQDRVISLVKEYGKITPALFVETTAAGRPLGGPGQVALILEGMKPRDLRVLKASLPKTRNQPAFAISDAPSTEANQYLLDSDLKTTGIARSGCGIDAISTPSNTECWTDGVFVDGYDFKKTPAALDFFVKHLGTVLNLVDQGKMEVMLMIVPESSRSSPIRHWSTDPPSHLHSRSADSESVIAEDPPSSRPKEQGHSQASLHPFVATQARIPDCFQSSNSCITQTNNCSSHGVCLDKFTTNGKQRRAEDGEEKFCFVCHCYSTLNRPEKEGQGVSTTHWGGNMCQKIDISTPFWLIVGFSVTIIGALTFAIGLLFSVGEERLPGVIGAGVSRTK